LADPSENVSLTGSPAPSFVRARLEGMVATVCDVIFAFVQGHGAADPAAGHDASPAALDGALTPGDIGVLFGIGLRTG